MPAKAERRGGGFGYTLALALSFGPVSAGVAMTAATHRTIVIIIVVVGF